MLSAFLYIRSLVFSTLSNICQEIISFLMPTLVSGNHKTPMSSTPICDTSATEIILPDF